MSKGRGIVFSAPDDLHRLVRMRSAELDVSRSALAGAIVWYTLTREEMDEDLLEYIQHVSDKGGKAQLIPPDGEEE